MQFLKTVLTRISTGTAGTNLALLGAGSCALRGTSCKIGLAPAGIVKRTGLGLLGQKGRQVCRFGRQNSLYGLHCDRDTARLVSVFAKGTIRPVGRADVKTLN